MLVRLYKLRTQGRRLKEREIRALVALHGDLVMSSTAHPGIGAIERLDLIDPETSLSNLRATLFQPVLISLASQAFAFRGFERIETGEGAFSVMQEWRCELVT
jgi:hypothetical protein